MDFKVAGNAEGISTFQLDIKSEGLSMDILEKALQQAKRGRLSILSSMSSALNKPRAMKDTVAKIASIEVPPDCLGKIIGPKGKAVKSLIEAHNLVNINLEDDGNVQIEGFKLDDIDAAKETILKLVSENKEGGRAKDAEEEMISPRSLLDHLLKPVLSTETVRSRGCTTSVFLWRFFRAMRASCTYRNLTRIAFRKQIWKLNSNQERKWTSNSSVKTIRGK